MFPTYIPKSKLDTFIKTSFKEDVEDGDHTTLATIDINSKGNAVLWAKDKGIVAGVLLTTEIVKYVQPDAHLIWHVADGDAIFKGDE